MRQAGMDALKPSDVTRFDAEGRVVQPAPTTAAITFPWMNPQGPGVFEDIPFARMQAACRKVKFVTA